MFDVGSIVAKLELKKDQWDQSIATVKKDNQDLGGFILNNEKSFRMMGTAMTVAGTAIVGSMGLMIENFTTAGSQIYDLSLKTGFSTIALSELDYAAVQCGTNLGGIEIAAKRMAITITEASDGSTTATESLDSLGLSAKTLKDLKPEDQFFAIADALSKVKDPSEQAALAVKVFGRSGTDVLPIINDTEKGLAALRREAHDLGNVYDLETAKKADALGDAQARLKTSVEGLGLSIAQKLTPPLTTLIGKITSTITKIQDWAKEHPGLTDVITKGALAIGGLMIALGPLIIALPGLIKSFGLVKAAISGVQGLLPLLVSPIGAIALGIGALAAIAFKTKTDIDSMNSSLDTIELAAGKPIPPLERLWAQIDNIGYIINTAVNPAMATFPSHADMMKDAADRFKDSLLLAIPPSKDWGDLISQMPSKLESTWTAIDTTKLKEEAWVTFMKEQGIITVADKSAKIIELQGNLDILGQKFRDGVIDQGEYEKASSKIRDEMEALRAKGRDEIIPVLTDITTNIDNQWSALEDLALKWPTISDAADTSSTEIENTVKTSTDNIVAKWKEGTDDIKTDTDTKLLGRDGVKDKWLGLYADITRDWGDKIKIWCEGGTTFKDFLIGDKGIFGSIKTAFFTYIGDMTAEWGEKLLKGILGSTEDTVGSMSSGKGILGIFGKIPPGLVGLGAAIAVIFDEDVRNSIMSVMDSICNGIGNMLDSFFGSYTLPPGAWVGPGGVIYPKPGPGYYGGGPPVEQHGFEQLVTRPTYFSFIAGEAGTELVSVKNRSQMQEAGMMSQQNKSTVNNININISSWDSRDTERWARGEGKDVIKELFRQNLGGITEKTETYLKTYRK